MTVTRWCSRTSHYSRDTLAVIMAGGSGTRLGDLTRWRAKPALPFGGRYRSIDFPLSNCVHSGIRRIGILTQYKAHSLIQHVQYGWQFLHPELGEFIEIWPAQQRHGEHWYAGTADAVFQNMDIITEQAPEYVLVLAGDHVYKMDYESMIRRHADSGADVTVGAIEVPLSEAREFGVLATDAARRIVAFDEKPGDPAPIRTKPTHALASMGIYVFSRDCLAEVLARDAADPASRHDFGRNILPGMLQSHHVVAYPFRDRHGRQAYWRDIGTIDAYRSANMDLLEPGSGLELRDGEWPIWTSPCQAPPAQFLTAGNGRHGVAIDSLVCNGCVVSGATVNHSVLSTNVTVQPGSEISDSVIMPDVTVGRGCRIRDCIVDNGCSIPDGTVIGFDPAADAERFRLSAGGTVLVTAEMLRSDAFVATQTRVA